jgi:hypothetical protein
MPRLALALAAGLASACGGTTVTSTDPDPVDSWLVWSATDGVARTEWLAADGTVRGQRDGVVIARQSLLYTAETSSIAVATTPCEAQEAAAAAGDAPAEATASGSATRIALAPLVPRTGASIDVAVPDVPAPGPDVSVDAEHQHGALITAGLGPYLFVTESVYVYSCGAHGNSHVGAGVVDIESGQRIDLMAGVDLTAARDTARRQLAESAAADGLEGDPGTSTVELGASVPTWTDGRLAMRHLFWTDACYACSDGEWSSYTRATRVDDPALPPALALVGVPPAVAARLSALPEPRGVSWGKATKAWATALPAPRR